MFIHSHPDPLFSFYFLLFFIFIFTHHTTSAVLPLLAPCYRQEALCIATLTDAGEKSHFEREGMKARYANYIYVFGDKFLCLGRLWDRGLRGSVQEFPDALHGRRSPFREGGVVHFFSVVNHDAGHLAG